MISKIVAVVLTTNTGTVGSLDIFESVLEIERN